MTVGAAATAALAGRRVLVAEDEYVIARDVAEALAAAGAEVLGPVPSVAAALRLAASEAGRIDAALLDVSLRGEAVWPVADALLARGVPVVLATGYETVALPEAYARLPRCAKPARGRDLVRALAGALAPPPPAGG